MGRLPSKNRTGKDKQPQKFFDDVEKLNDILKGIPLVALNALAIEPNNRVVLINVIRTCFHIFELIGANLIEDMKKLDQLDTPLKEGITLKDLEERGMKIEFTKDGPIVVPK